MKEEDKKVWVSELVECDLCSYQWRAVHHIKSEKLECPNCENMVHYEPQDDAPFA